MAREAIFIGYRREDTADVAGRMYDALAARFGRRRMFKDVDNLRPGADFGAHIRSILPRCRAVLVLIGPGWLNAKDETGRRRLDDPNDWVRIEVETALAAEGVDVVPVLVNGAQMPRAEELPESLRPLLNRHAAVVRRDPDFHDDAMRLATALNASAAGPAGARRASRPPLFIALAAVAMGLVSAGVLMWPRLIGGAAGSGAADTADRRAPAATRIWRNGEEFDDCAGQAWCPTMIVVPAGVFAAGSLADEPGRFENEALPRNVGVRQFAAGKFEVTFAQWDECVRRGGCASNPEPSDQGWGRGTRPVINVSWNDAQEYVRWLSSEGGVPYRLLSEREWEYAARAGTSGAYWWGQEPSHEHANFGADTCCAGAASGRDEWLATAPVGQFPANPFGLHDLNGNVWEWVADCAGAAGYESATADHTDAECAARVSRGGSWGNSPAALRSAARYGNPPSYRDYSQGFRVARTLN